MTDKSRVFPAIIYGIVYTLVGTPIATQASIDQKVAPQQVLTKQNKPLNPEEGIEFLKESKHGYDIESLVLSRDGQRLVSGSL